MGIILIMKMNLTHNSVAVSDDFKSLDFGIRSCDMGIILETLRSKMYRNPIGAICREISSNSRDANRESRNSRVPISIKIDKDILNPGEITISFIDDGPGISEERISDIFVNYGASTKRDTNRLTGSFGFGSKTPFAYSDSFSIITKIDGIKYTYVAAIEENNTGKIYLLKKGKTSESNGTSIVIPIKKADIETFETECIKATWFWEPRPNYINFRYFKDIKIESMSYHDGLFVKTYDGVYSEYYYLLIDGIPYELLNHEQLKFPFINRRGQCRGQCFFLKFKTGQLTISSNRESVQYDDSTIRAIKSSYKKLCDNLKFEIQNKINLCPNRFEAYLIVREYINHPLFSHLSELGVDKFYYKDEIVEDRFSFEFIKLFKFSNNEKMTVSCAAPDMRDGIYIVNSILSSGRNKALLKSKNSFFYVDIPKKVRKFSKKSFKEKRSLVRIARGVSDDFKYLKSLGIPLLPYSDIVPEKVFKKSNNIIDKICIHRENKSRRWATLESIDKSSLYKVDDGCIDWRLIKFIKSEFDINIFVISKRFERYVKGQFKNFDIKNFDKSKLQVYSDVLFLYKKGYNFNESIILKLKIPELSELDVSFLSKIREKSKIIYSIPKNINSMFPESPAIKSIENKLKLITNKYPLIKLDSGEVKIKDFQKYIDGINLLEEKGALDD